MQGSHEEPDRMESILAMPRRQRPRLAEAHVTRLRLYCNISLAANGITGTLRPTRQGVSGHGAEMELKSCYFMPNFCASLCIPHSSAYPRGVAMLTETDILYQLLVVWLLAMTEVVFLPPICSI